MPPDLSVLIVNFNSGPFLKRCLKSVFEFTQDLELEVIVVDNASSDRSMEGIAEEFPQVNLILNSQNLYFSKASNMALERSKGRYLMLLNPDTHIVDNAFRKLVDFMERRRDAGACGPKFLNFDGTLQAIGNRYPTPLYVFFEFSFVNTLFPDNPVRRNRRYGELNEREDREIEATGGACMLVRREALQKAGILDERFLMYAEETDWCYRIRQAGWKIFYVSGATVYHYGGGSAMTEERGKMDKIFRRSLLYFCRKHYGFFAFFFLSISSSLNFWLLHFYRRLKAVGK